MITKKKWAIVTGASKGLGYCYCEFLLQQDYNLVAVARNCDSLMKLKQRFPTLEIKTFNFDLSQSNSCYELFNECQTLSIDLLINNAGFGILGNFLSSDLDEEINMINLNIVGIQILTKLFAQKMVLQGFGRIINISSIAAFFPGPSFASYYASKSYVLQLSIAINTELKITKTPIRVIAVCPGTLKTEFWARSNSASTTKKILNSKIPIMDLSIFAKKSLLKANKLKNKNFVVLGFINHFLLALAKIIPKRIFLRIIYKFQKKR